MTTPKHTSVRAWPIAEAGEPRIHLIEFGLEVIGLTLCGLPARHPMSQTPESDITGLEMCAECVARIATDDS